MTHITRRGLGALALGALATTQARAQGAGLRFMSFTYAEDPNRPFVQALIDGFRASSGIMVEPIGSAWGDMQRNVLLRSRSRTLPEVVQLQDRWLPAMAQLPEMADLNQVLGQQALEAALDPSVLPMGRVGNRMVGLPIISGSIGFVANREVMARAGIDRAPTTLDEFRMALMQVRDRVPNSVPFAMATKNPASIPLDVLLLVWAHGGRLINDDGTVLVDSAEGRAAFAYMAGLMRDRLIAPEIDRPDARRLFAQGTACFYVDAPAARSFARTFSGRGEAADAFVLPFHTPVIRAGEAPRSIEWGHILSAFRAGGAPAADSPTARFLQHILSDGVQTTLPLQLGGLPVTKAGRAAPVVQNDAFLRAWAQAVGTTMKHEVGIWANGPELSTILAEETQATLLGQKASDAAVAAMQTRMSASMARRGN